MLGFLIGTACLIGLIRVLRAGPSWGGPLGAGGWGRFGGHRACGAWAGGGGDFDGLDAYDGGACGGVGGRGGGAWHGRGAWRRGRWGRSAILRAIFERLDTTPGQEKAIRAALDDLRGAARSAREEARAARTEVARVIRADQVDEAAWGDVSARANAAAEAMRRAALDALTKIHAALDDRQRGALADLIESGPGLGALRGVGGPYRGGAHA